MKMFSGEHYSGEWVNGVNSARMNSEGWTVLGWCTRVNSKWSTQVVNSTRVQYWVNSTPSRQYDQVNSEQYSGEVPKWTARERPGEQYPRRIYSFKILLCLQGKQIASIACITNFFFFPEYLNIDFGWI